ncbi:MAG TPA: PEGA domain-containing protein [Kofleriaceae bacterium]
MLSRRIIVVSPDKAFGKQLAVACKAAGGAVDLFASIAELGKLDGVALVVAHLDGDLATAAAELLPRLVDDARLIAVLPRSNLAAVVDVMQASERVAGMLVAETLALSTLSAMVTRVLAGDIFGLEKLVPWGAQVHSFLVGDYQEKALCISRVSEFAELMGVRRKYRESVEQCLDEMLMNALYDAPVDEQGNHIFSEIPIKTRISLRVEQKAVVQYACTGSTFAIAVRDAFGTLDRATVLRYLHKCLHAEQQIDRKAGGAGLGLYLMTSAASTVYFNVLPGVATEAVCTFELDAAKVQLAQFGFFYERIDSAGRLAAGPSRRLPAGASHPVERRATAAPSGPPRGVVIALTAAIVATLGLVGIAAYPRLLGAKHSSLEVHTTPGAIIEVDGHPAGTATTGTLVVPDLAPGKPVPVTAHLDGYQPRETVVAPNGASTPVALELVALPATVTIDSKPTGAEVFADGKSLGTTPLTVTTFAPSSSVTLTFKRSGYKDVDAPLAVPAAGKTATLEQPLAAADDIARVHLESDPPGATVSQNGQELAGIVTPCDVVVPAGKPVSFTLRLPDKLPATVDSFTPAGGGEPIVKHVTLTAGAAVHVTSNLPGKVTVTGAPCHDLPTPATCTAAPGTHKVELELAGLPKLVHLVTVGAADIDVKFALGYVEAPAGKLVQTGAGNPGKKLVLEAGTHKVNLISPDGPPQPVMVTVHAGTSTIALDPTQPIK